MSYTAEDIRSLLERHDRAVESRRRALGSSGRDDEPIGELDALTAGLSPAERDVVGRYLQALVRAEARD